MNQNKYNLDGSINFEGSFDMNKASIDVIEIDIGNVSSMAYASEMHSIEPDDFKDIRDHYSLDELETQAYMIMLKTKIAAREHRANRQAKGSYNSRQH